MKPLKTTLAALSILCANALGQTSNTSPTADYLLDLSWKDLKFTNVMALAENAAVEVRGIDPASSASSLWYYLSARDGTALAITTNVVASTNANAAIGYLNLATTNLQAQFAGANPIAEKNFVFSVWDTARDVLLASALVGVKNNPMANGLISGWTNLPASLTNEFSASVLAALDAAWNAQFVASNAYALAYGIATTNEPLWTAASNRVLYVGDIAETAYGTETNTAYRGDWGASVSNLAASAYSLAISNDNAVLRSIATVPASAAYSAAASESLPYVVTNSEALTLSGLTAGSIGIRLTTTNASGVALYAAVVKDGDGETLATINPSCDGSEQSARWPWNASETLTVEAYSIASPAEEAESAIITAVQVETWEDVSLVGRTNDLADQHLYVDYPAATNEAANRAYADDAADAALALALGEIATATFNRDLAGYVQRWNPRFDTVAASNSLSTLYGGSTALRLDGEGAAVVPEIRAFAVEAGEVATLTVWSYSGGASNLVPEVTTNLITGSWERKPESIVSATNIDAFTAQVVFTNDFERLLYVRLVDVSGGTGVPVLRVFGGIAFGDGAPITDWPQGTILGATINGPHTVATNDGILAFTVVSDGSGWTNLAFSGTGNAITGATAAADTLTLQRGEIEGGGTGDGSLAEFVATHTNSLQITNSEIARLELVAGDNVLLSHVVDSATSSSVVRVSASSAIKGPQGPPGVGGLVYAGTYDAGATYTNPATLVSFGRATYYTTNQWIGGGVPSPTNTDYWTTFVLGGEDGADGSSGADGVGFNFLGPWSTNVTSIGTNDAVALGGQLFAPWVGLSQEGGIPRPVSGDGVVNTNDYYVLVAKGADGASGSVSSNLFFAGNWKSDTAYPEMSVVVYSGQAYYATEAITGPSYPIPGGAPWATFAARGATGPRGVQGVDGIGNLQFQGFFNPLTLYPSNSVVAYPTNKPDWYRAKTLISGQYPTATNYWEKVLMSGLDASVFGVGYSVGYNPSTYYPSNHWLRHNGAVYASRQPVTGFGNQPPNATYWELVVRDGTTLSTGLVWRGEWAPGTYVSNDLVSRAGSSYFVNTSNTVQSPPNTDWTLFVQKGDKGDQGPAGTAAVYNVYYQTNLTVLTQNVWNVTNNSYYVETNVYDTFLSHTSIVTEIWVTNEYTNLGVSSADAYRGDWGAYVSNRADAAYQMASAASSVAGATNLVIGAEETSYDPETRTIYSPAGTGGGEAATLVVTQMPYLAQALVTGTVVGVYDNANVGFTETLLFGNANSNSFVFEELNAGTVTGLTTLANSTTQGILSATTYGTKITNGCVLRIGGASYGIQALTGGTNVTFLPALNSNTSYAVESIRGVSHTSVALHQGAAGTTNGPFVDLVAGNKSWIGISVAPDGTTIYAVVYNGSIWKSTDSGATWVDLAVGSKQWRGISVAPDGTTIYAAVNGGSIWKSTDSGATWVDLVAGNKKWIGISVAPDGTTIYATVENGSIWKSVDAGATWVDLVAGNKNWRGISVAPDGTTIYAVVWSGSIWKSVDAGATWVDLATGNKYWQEISVAPDGTTIYAAVSGGSIWKSTDSGATWVDLAVGSKQWRGISVAPDGTTIYATVYDGSIWRSEWSAYAPVLGVGHTVATIPMATTTNWRYINDIYFRDNANYAGTFYSISWQTNCWSIYSTNASAWRVVVTNDAGDWKWNSNGTFVAQAGLTNNELGTLSFAVQSSVSNRMNRLALDSLDGDNYREAGGFATGYSPRTAVTFLNTTTNLPPRVYERRVLVDDLRYEQKMASTNDYNLYLPTTNSPITIVTKKVARTCDVVIKYLKDQP